MTPSTLTFPDIDDFDPEDCHAMGWGKDSFGDSFDNFYNTFLRSVPIHMVDNESCQQGLRNNTILRLL